MCLLPYLRCLSLGIAYMEEAIFSIPSALPFQTGTPEMLVAFAALNTLGKTSRLLTALDLTWKPSSNFLKFQICNTRRIETSNTHNLVTTILYPRSTH